MASQRIWSTIHDGESARKAVEVGVGAAFMLSVVCLAMTVQGFLTKRAGLEIMGLYAVIYGAVAWRARVKPRGGACDCGLFLLVFLLAAWWKEPALHLRDFWDSVLPVLVFFAAVGLLNGVRGSSYLLEFPEKNRHR